MNQKEKQSAPKSARRILSGQVVSDKTDKTAVVLVTRYKQHPKYKKRYRVDKKYQAHDESNKCQIGDKVLIQENRPISRNKRWVVKKKIS